LTARIPPFELGRLRSLVTTSKARLKVSMLES
jgi:hypothetical protein